MRRVGACALVLAALGCSGGDSRWTVERAESISTIRGMKVHVLSCQEVRPARLFRCQAGARRAGEKYDTVGIFYDVRVLPSGGYTLEDVRFIGGPGIP